MAKILDAIMTVETCTAFDEETRSDLRTILMEVAKVLPETEQELQDLLWVSAPRDLVNNCTTFRKLADKLQLHSFELFRLRDENSVAYRAIMPVVNEVLKLYNELLRRKINLKKRYENLVGFHKHFVDHYNKLLQELNEPYKF